MISYRPTPELPAGRTGFRAALGAMVLAAVLGTTAFVPTAFVPAGAAPLRAEDRAVVGSTVSTVQTAVSTVQAAVSAERTVRRQDGPFARDAATGRPLA